MGDGPEMSGMDDGRKPDGKNGFAGSDALAARVPVRPRQGFFDIYKRGQGYYTRVCTAAGAGIIILAGAHYLYNKLSVLQEANWKLYVQAGAPFLLAVGLGFLLFWLVGVKRRTCNFLIATEGEMKKVSWSSRREVIGSTKVVIFAVIILATLLFVVDVFFMLFFHTIGVLKVAPEMLTRLIGLD